MFFIKQPIFNNHAAPPTAAKPPQTTQRKQREAPGLQRGSNAGMGQMGIQNPRAPQEEPDLARHIRHPKDGGACSRRRCSRSAMLNFPNLAGSLPRPESQSPRDNFGSGFCSWTLAISYLGFVNAILDLGENYGGSMVVGWGLSVRASIFHFMSGLPTHGIAWEAYELLIYFIWCLKCWSHGNWKVFYAVVLLVQFGMQLSLWPEFTNWIMQNWRSVRETCI